MPSILPELLLRMPSHTALAYGILSMHAVIHARAARSDDLCEMPSLIALVDRQTEYLTLVLLGGLAGGFVSGLAGFCDRLF